MSMVEQELEELAEIGAVRGSAQLAEAAGSYCWIGEEWAKKRQLLGGNGCFLLRKVLLRLLASMLYNHAWIF